MFTSQKVKHFIQSVKFAGDAEKPTLTVVFYVTPMTYDLAYELSDRIAKQLFRKEGSAHVPIHELESCDLNLGEIAPQNIEFYPHDADGADGAGQMIPSCQIGKVSVDKLFADSPDWSLIWHATMQLNYYSLELVHKYYKKHCFLTLEAAQDGLFDTQRPVSVVSISDSEVEAGKLLQCETCQQTAGFLGTDLTAWCEDHVGAAVGTEVRRIRYAEGAA